MRLERVVELESRRVELAVLAQDVVRRVGKEQERWVVAEPRRIGEAPVPEEPGGEQFGRPPGSRVRSGVEPMAPAEVDEPVHVLLVVVDDAFHRVERHREADRKSTRLNSSHGYISYAVFCLKKKK